MSELTYSRVNRDILRTLERPGKGYFALLGLVLLVLVWGAIAWIYQIYTGMGVAGFFHPVLWAVYITNFVFWVGIAHSGTLISAILFLLRARWRTSVFRSAEAMTVFAILTAGLFPLIHLGRVWYFYWLIPYPNQRGLWVNFRSPLLWDVFAVSTYFTVSVIFLYIGMVPDIAVVRDRAKGLRRTLYRALSLGWQGTDQQWRHYRGAYGFFAALATPLVISVHSVVSWDFAMSIVPGWHSTIFAPYFVSGAIHSGLAMVTVLLIPLRRAFGLEEYVTLRHFENLAKLIIVTGLIMGYSYATEFFIAWYSGGLSEKAIFLYRAVGDYALLFWLMILFNSIVPLFLFFKQVRTSLPALFVIALLINLGMWLERFVIITTSLTHEYDPYSWGLGVYHPTWVEYSITAGSFAWFFFWFLLFIKLFPSVSIVEVKEQLGPPLKRTGSEP